MTGIDILNILALIIATPFAIFGAIVLTLGPMVLAFKVIGRIHD